MGGSLLVRSHSCILSWIVLDTVVYPGNYDITKMHYDGPGDVPGSDGVGYGYDVRVEGRSSGPSTTAPAVAVQA